MKRETRPDPFVQEVFARNPETIKPWVKAEPSSHIWVARLPPSLEPGVHVVDEFRDSLILEVTWVKHWPPLADAKDSRMVSPPKMTAGQ